MDDQVLAQFLTKIDVNQDRERLSNDQIFFMVARGILDSSSTIVSRALCAARYIISAGKESLNNFMLEVNKLCSVQVDPPTHNILFNFLLARCEDERVNSRKAAISALEALYIQLNDDLLTDICLEKLQLRCRDHSLTIRKQAADSLTNILKAVPSNKIESVWLRSVMSLIVDREIPVQQYCAKLVADVLITPIALKTECISWRLLSLIEQQIELRRLLLRVLIFINNEKNIPLCFVDILEFNCNINDHSNAAWMLLGELSAFTKVNPVNAVKFWSSSPKLDDVNNRVVQYVSKVISNGANFLDNTQRETLKRQIADALFFHRLCTTHIPAVYYSFAKICNAIGENADGKHVLQKFNEEWFGNGLKELDSIIYEEPSLPIILGNSEKRENLNTITTSQESQVLNYMNVEERNKKCVKLERIIFSIGECLQYTPNLLNRSLFKILKLIIASDKLIEINPSTDPTPRPQSVDMPYRSQSTVSVPLSQNTCFNIDCGRETPAMMLKGKVVRHEFFTRRVRAQSVLTLGKLCLLDERLAKKCVPVFVRELKINNDYIIRNNIVVVVCDLCIRYTLLVDRYSAILASCLNDSSVLVRQQTLMLLTNLIKEQFLKWEGSIIYRFVTELLDSNQKIKEYAEFCLADILLPQFPLMFFNHFLECLFYFNQVKHQSWMENDGSSTNENSSISLAGAGKFQQRMKLYQFMIKTFTDDQKYKICERIACEVFASIHDDKDSTSSSSVEKTENNRDSMLFSNPNVINLMLDSFKIMRCQEIKLSLQVGQRPVDDQADEDDPSEERTKAARKLIAKVFGDKIVDATVPHLLQLREFLMEKRSPLVHECFAVIMELYKDYHQNFDDIFASDPLLKSEIEFKLKEIRREERKNDHKSIELDDDMEAVD